jgi:thiamine-phosphate pyrophosphorylase
VRPLAPGDAARAARAGAGLHLRAADLRTPGLPFGADPADYPLITAAIHGASAFGPALDRGVGLGLASPVFAPRSKPGDSRPPLGLEGLRALCVAAPFPLLGLGGVGPADAPALRAAGAWGWAAIGAFFPPEGAPREESQPGEPGAE